MDYSTWLTSSTSLSLSSNTNGNTLRLFQETPVRNNEVGVLTEELKKAKEENKRLTEMLTAVCENYNDLKRQLMDYMSTKSGSSNELVSNVAKKRKVDISINSNDNKMVQNNNNVESSSSDEEDSCVKLKEEEVLKPKVSRVSVRTEASNSTLILKDGYQWRKYGQKVTRDNPCPRAYFKCSFAPTCPVKKKVQRSLEDQSMLVATYEGEHNHAPPSQEAISGTNRAFNLGSVPCTTTLGSSGPTLTLDLTKPKPNTSNEAQKPLSNTNSSSTQNVKFNSPEFQKLLAEQMASSLTKDPNFTSALAAAMSGRFARQSSSDN